MPTAPFDPQKIHDGLITPCPKCVGGMLERRPIQGLETSAQHPEMSNCTMGITLEGGGDLPYCGQCFRITPLTREDWERRDAAYGRFWARRLRWRWGVRIHADDEISLGVSWALCHEGRPLTFFLLGLVIKIGCFQGDASVVKQK